MTKSAFPPEFEPRTPREYETLNPNDLEKVSPGEFFPAGRRIIGGSSFLLELEEDEVLRSRRLFEDDAAYEAFYGSYTHSRNINQEFAGLLLEDHRQPSKIQHDIRLFNQLIERFPSNNPYDAEMRTSLQALKNSLYVSSESDLRERADSLTGLVDTSELELWVVARKNYRNKDAVAAQLKGAGVVDFGRGKALRPLVMDKNGTIGTLPRVYYADPRLHTPVSADKL